MVAKLLDVNKPCGPANNEIKKRKTDLYDDFPRLCMIALNNKEIPHTFLPSFDNGCGRLCHTFLLYWPIADRRVPSNDPTNNYIIFALHTHCPVKGTKLLEETATARTICIGMPSNEGIRPQSPLGVVEGAKLEITSTELR